MDSFCPKCKVILFPKETEEGIFIECSTCGFKRPYNDWTEHLCSKCNHTKAYVVYHAMVMGDEGTTTIYRCINCGNSEKEGFKG